MLACRWVRYSKGTALVFTIDKDIGIGKHVIQHRQTQTLTYANTCVQAHSHVYACRHMCMSVCVHVCMHMHVCISPSQSKLNYFIFSIMGKKLKLWAPPKIKPGDEKRGERRHKWEWQEQHDGNMMLVKVVRYI